VVALCIYRYTQFDGRSARLLRIALACRGRAFHVRVFAASWHGARPTDIEIVIVPVEALTDFRRFDRYVRWVTRALSTSPAHCVVGFEKMPGLDVYFAHEGAAAETAANLRTRRFRGSGAFKVLQDAERSLLKSDAEIVYPCSADAERFALSVDPSRVSVLPIGVDDAPSGGRRGHVDAARDGEVVLLFVASDFVSDGFDRVLFMLSRLSDVERKSCRLLAVTAADVVTAAFARMADGMGILDCVEFETADDLSDAFERADILLHVPYGCDTNPVVLDALARGVPVIASAACGYAQCIRRGALGVVLDTPFDQRQFNACVARALTAPARRQWRENVQRHRDALCRESATERAIEIIDRRIQRRGQALST